MGSKHRRFSLRNAAWPALCCGVALCFLPGPTASAQRMMPFSFWQQPVFAPGGTAPARIDVPKDTVVVAENGGDIASRKGRAGLDLVGSMPQSPSLEVWQPWPNPFGASTSSASASTSIRIKLAGDAPVTVRLFTMLSQPVAMLFDAVLAAGPHTLRILPPSDLPGGTYFVGISSGNTALLLRIVYLR